MIRQPARPPAFPLALAGAALLMPLAPIAAQEAPPTGSFELPPPSPTPAPAPAGPADERAGVAIPPRTAPAPVPAATPVIQPLPSPRANEPLTLPTPRRAPAAPSSPAAAASNPVALPPSGPLSKAVPDAQAGQSAISDDAAAPAALPAWWPLAAGVMAALALLGSGAWLWARRKPKALRIAAPADELPRLDLTLDITGATRSLMMFTLRYRLTIANRSEQAVTDLSAAIQLACARASSGARSGTAPNAPSPVAQIDRVGPHQSRSITGEVQLPLSAIVPLRQGTRPLFVPLVHATIEGQHQGALTKSFVIGTPSASGRVHPIPLDVPAGAVDGLVAQAIAVPAPPAAAPAAA